MTVFDWRIEWKRTSDKETTIPITDCISANIHKSIEIKNNICQLTLKNAPTNISSSSGYMDTLTDASVKNIIGDYVETSTQTIKFGEEDEIRVWADFLDDASEVGTAWYDDARLLGSFGLEEYQVQTLENQARVQIKAVDAAYILFNKIHNYSYGIAMKFTSPGIIRHCARFFGESSSTTVTPYQGTDHDTGTYYAIDAKFVSEGGNITDYRDSPSTQLNGSITNSVTTITVDSTTGFEDEGSLVIGSEHVAYTSKNATQFLGCTRGIDDTGVETNESLGEAHADNTAVYQGFPLIIVSKIWKPLFEWIGEMSQTENTNYLSEIQEGGTYFYGRAFIFWIDKNNSPHWFYPDDTVDLTIELGEEGRRSFRLDKSVFDAVNFIIYNCGEDMYGNGIIYYLYDETSEVASLKMRFQPMISIVHTLINEDRKQNASRDTTNQDIFKQFPSSYPMSPSFLAEANIFRASIGESARANVASDIDYNDCLREAAKQRGMTQALKITSARSGLRYKGQIPLKGTHINPGDLVKVTNPFVGLASQLLRVIEVTHTINANGWETVLDVQEDEKTVI